MRDTFVFVPRASLDAKANLREFVDLVRTRMKPLGLDGNRFENHAWSIAGLGAKGGATKFIYFARLAYRAKKHASTNGTPSDVPENLRMREPCLSFAKALLTYMHSKRKTTALTSRLNAFCYLEAALYELNADTCPTATMPDVLNRACTLAVESLCHHAAYSIGKQLEVIYRFMVELGLVAVPSDWKSPICQAQQNRTRVGKQFDQERYQKLPSAQALEALAAIFNSGTDDPRAIFVTSLCALMLCSPDRSVEALYAPLDILTPDWTDHKAGDVGIGLRWFPAKGAAPMVKTVIPSMRDIAVRAVENLRRLSEPARKLALWYEKHPNRIYLPTHLESLRSRELITTTEVHSILYGGETDSITRTESNRTLWWLHKNHVPVQSAPGRLINVAFGDVERAVLAMLPEGFPVMDPATGMHYSEALCLTRISEMKSRASSPFICSFDRIRYVTLQCALKSQKRKKSIFEELGYRDTDGKFLSMSSHMLRHYLNTLVRQSGALTEEDIAKWSGRKNVRQNATYNHESDRDVIERLRNAVGDPSKSVGPFANIDNRVFIRRDEFADIKIITAHTSEFGYCIHDYAQSPCQVHADCINCNEQVCIKGDQRAEANLRKMQVETTLLQEKARAAFSAEVLNAAEWFQQQTKTLERINQLIAILADPDVPQGSVIQLSGVVPPSRLAMAEEERHSRRTPVSQTIASLDDVRALLTGANHKAKETADAG
ncbi:MAG: hypothetical protein WC100_04280 [Sterolibacterium sp.]